MPASGLRLTVLAGATVPAPLPAALTARLRKVTVTESDTARGAFTLELDAGRTGPLPDVPGTTGPLAPLRRVVVVLTFGAVPVVLCDGVVTETALTPGDAPGVATLTVHGDDVSALLDREQRDVEHPGLGDAPQVLRVLAPYATRGVVPRVVPPPTIDLPLPVERVPTQHGTDLEHLVTLAARHGYVTYPLPGPVPGISTFYWGPPVRAELPQPALSVDLGPETNTGALTVRTEALTPVAVAGVVKDRRTGTTVPVATAVPLRLPLSAVPLTASAGARTVRLRDAPSTTTGALGAAQAVTDAAADGVVAEGELDGARYGGVLRARGLVGVRGAGWSNDGLWYVRQVTHTLAPGSYTAAFVLTRDGHGSTVPAVPVRSAG